MEGPNWLPFRRVSGAGDITAAAFLNLEHVRVAEVVGSDSVRLYFSDSATITLTGDDAERFIKHIKSKIIESR